MKKQTILKGLVIGVCVLSLAGCGTKQAEIQGEKDMSVAGQYQNDIPDTEDTSLNRDEKDSAAPETNDTNGIGNGNTEQPMSNKDTVLENQNNTTANDMGERVDAESLYLSAAMTGSVVEFSDGSCTVSATVTEDDGETAVAAAPGHESDDTNVVVTYQEGCVVQIATIYTSTGTAELEQASVADIKKQSSVIIYGSFEDTHHVTATKVIICHRTA